MKHFLNDNGLSSFTSVLDLLHTWDNENCEYDSYPSMLSLISRTSSIVNWSSKSAFKFIRLPSKSLNEK